jgi:hypothetical protein
VIRRERVKTKVLSTNEILSDQEQLDLPEILANARKHVHSLDLDIIRLQDTYDAILKLRAQGIARISRPEAGFVPHKQPPPEILSNIFAWRMREAQNKLPPQKYHSLAWEISQVCARWRWVALAEPSLWNRLHISETFGSSPHIIRALHEIFSNRGGGEAIEFEAMLSVRDDWMTIIDLIKTFLTPRRASTHNHGCVMAPQSPSSQLRQPQNALGEVFNAVGHSLLPCITVQRFICGVQFAPNTNIL